MIKVCEYCSRYIKPGQKTTGDSLVFHFDEVCPKAPPEVPSTPQPSAV